MRDVGFAKGQALGNDYLVVERGELPGEPTAEWVGRFCDRHRGVGSDGILLADLSGGGFRLRILNPDGSEAEKSGNGLRIFGAYLHAKGLVGQEWFEVQLVKDRVSMRVEEVLGGGLLQIRVQMGRAVFRGDAVGFRPEAGEVVDGELALPGGRTARITTVSMANPHCVVLTERLDREDFLERAPALCGHAAFVAGTNVQFARVVGPRLLEAWIWERGVGETLASGSSACAVAAAAVRQGKVTPGTFEVRMRGGSAEVEVDDGFRVKLRGPAQIVFQGEVPAVVAEGWG